MTKLNNGLAADLNAVTVARIAGDVDSAIVYDRLFFVGDARADMFNAPDKDAPVKAKAFYQDAVKVIVASIASVHGAGFISLFNAEKGKGKPIISDKQGYNRLIDRSTAQRWVSGTLGSIRKALNLRHAQFDLATTTLEQTDLELWLKVKRDPECKLSRIERIAFDEICREIEEAQALKDKAERDAVQAERNAKAVQVTIDAIRSIKDDMQADSGDRYKCTAKVRAELIADIDALIVKFNKLNK